MRTLKGMCGVGLAVSLGLVGSQAPAQTSRDGGYVIRDVSVVDVEGGVVRSNQDVYVVDGRIPVDDGPRADDPRQQRTAGARAGAHRHDRPGRRARVADTGHPVGHEHRAEGGAAGQQVHVGVEETGHEVQPRSIDDLVLT